LTDFLKYRIKSNIKQKKHRIRASEKKDRDSSAGIFGTTAKQTAGLVINANNI